MACRRNGWKSRTLFVFCCVLVLIILYRWPYSNLLQTQGLTTTEQWWNIRTRSYAKCLEKEQTNFGTDLDTSEVYKTLNFRAGGNTGFWNRTFEERYLRIRETWKDMPLEVIVVPQSHTDPGWLKTFDEYYNNDVSEILDNMLKFLGETPDFKFIWSEISFFARWYEQLKPGKRAKVQSLLQRRQLEIVTGGWVMTDEATAHYWSIIDQLVEGHQWLKHATGDVPNYAWSVDVFGHSSTMPFLLTQAGLKAMVILRAHYAWKLFLAEHRMFDFRWGKFSDTRMLCHMAPSDLYSIKHACGPDPTVCLQFDFRRINGEYSESLASEISEENIKSKAERLVGQYGRFGSLFPHNVLLVPLGDDFRYNVYVEWKQQYKNYAKLFKYINDHYSDVRLRFGTVSDYFQEVRRRTKSHRITLPSIRGDFFPYGDVYVDGTPSYWTGFYSSRPFLKSLARELEHWLRTVEIVYSLARPSLNPSEKLKFQWEYRYLKIARQALALFQHHDAITGTSRREVMNDYNVQLHSAIKNCMGLLAYSSQVILMPRHPTDASDISTWTSKMHTDVFRPHAYNTTQKIPILVPSYGRKIVVFNSLTVPRRDIVRIHVKSFYIKVVDAAGIVVPFQINPVWSDPFSMRTDLFEVLFLCDIKPLTFQTYTLMEISKEKSDPTNTAAVSIHVDDESKFFKTHRSSNFPFVRTPGEEIAVRAPIGTITFGKNGLLKSIYRYQTSSLIKLHVGFYVYHSAPGRSGAYLFRPLQNALTPIQSLKNWFPLARIVRGKLSSEITFSIGSLLTSTTRIPHVQGLPYTMDVDNTFDMSEAGSDLELVMRINSNIDSKKTFYTDSNGFQILRRTYVDDLPVQGNYYPITSATYVEDINTRLNLFVSHSVGGSSPSPGALEIMLDRKIALDDHRGMDDNVMDNKLTSTSLRFLIESTVPGTHNGPNPILSPDGAYASKFLLYPLITLAVDSSDASALLNEKSFVSKPWPIGYHLVNLRTLPSRNDYNSPSNNSLLIIMKQQFFCDKNENEIGSTENLLKTFNLNVASSVPMSLTGVQSFKAEMNMTGHKQYFQTYNISFS